MLKQPSRLYIRGRAPEERVVESRKLSFTSLSKDKTHLNIKRHAQPRFGPVSPTNSALENSAKENKRINVVSQLETQDQYRLFSDIVKSNVVREKLVSSKPSLQSPTNKNKTPKSPFCEYYGTSFQNRSPRPQSRQKIQKYFSETPALIRPKSNTSNSKIVLKTQPNSRQECSPKIEMRKNTVNYHTFPPNEYYRQQPTDSIHMVLDEVNTSRASVKFDMSPCFQ